MDLTWSLESAAVELRRVVVPRWAEKYLWHLGSRKRFPSELVNDYDEDKIKEGDTNMKKDDEHGMQGLPNLYLSTWIFRKYCRALSIETPRRQKRQLHNLETIKEGSLREFQGQALSSFYWWI